MKRRDLILAGGAAGSAVFGLMATGYFARRRAENACLVENIECDPQGLFDLAPGFRYEILQRSGELMHDGYSVPDSPDSMACFESGNHYVLMRNHEISSGEQWRGPFQKGQKPPAEKFLFDKNGAGGVTRIVLEKSSLRLVSSNLVLAGTSRNCSGGRGPFGWLSCEETTEPGHGYVFHCPVAAQSVVEPKPLRMLGRMNHEAAVADFTTGIVYLTEDRDDGLFYRFVPSVYFDWIESMARNASSLRDFAGEWSPRIWESGVLQALVVEGFEGKSLNSLGAKTKAYPDGAAKCRWVDLAAPDSEDDSLRKQGRAKGASIVQRGEGLWLENDRVYFSATAGGPANLGQIFELEVGQAALDSVNALRVIFESNTANSLNHPDNLCVGPAQSLFIAEDNDGFCRLQVLTKKGSLKVFGRQRNEQREIAGVCFSPDQKVLFLNLQKEGLTLAIRGPFENFLSL